MIRIGQIKLEINEKTTYEENALKEMLTAKAAKKLRVAVGDITFLEISKHSVDARKKPLLFDVYVVDVTVKGNEEKLVRKLKDNNISLYEKKVFDFWQGISKENFSEDKRVVIVGCGPAGLFCGYELAKHGFKPLILERGSDVDKRIEIVRTFWEKGQLNPATNVQFGEGGAGTFSDGKLNTMVKDKLGLGDRVLDIFIDSGAPSKIRYEAKPHIGTDILQRVVKNIRNEYISAGGEILFDSQVTDILIGEGKVRGVCCNDKYYPCDLLVLAIGHSARDTFKLLFDKGVKMQPKPFAVGFRVEHPQSLINESQYGKKYAGVLPAAPYKLTTTTGEGRGVYSFCMCPGGYVVNASSEQGMLAVNGMSYSGRNGTNANSAIIITVDPQDFGGSDVLSGVEFQRNLEKKAYELAGGCIPVEYYGNFKSYVNGAGNDDIKHVTGFIHEDFVPQMKGDYRFANVHEILPRELNRAFVEGMDNFGRSIKGYNDDRALVSGVESRTSSPVRILRGEDGTSENVKGLFPCGEGAGYAGGIMSAAMDGIRIARLVARKACSDD